MINEPQHLSHKLRLQELELFSMEKSQENLTNVYLMGGNEKEEARLSSIVPIDRTRGSGHKFKHAKFHLNTRKRFVTLRVVKQWNGLLREIVKSPPIDTFKTRLDMVLGNLLYLTMLEQGGWTR